MEQILDSDSFQGPVHPDWCPGCGDYGVLKALKDAAVELQIPPHQLMVVSGIGCSSNMPGFINAYGAHTLHGRAVPIATGVKLANTDLNVVITGGDGDGYGLGLGHFVHAMRRNLNLTYIVMDNMIYGLTTGQTSPTSQLEHRTKTTPRGNAELPINPLALALITGATYVARGFSGNPKQLAQIFAGGIAHQGFALIDVFSPCVTWNKVNTYAFFRQRVYDINEKEDYDTGDAVAAMEKALEFGERIPTGLIYRTERPTYEESEPVLQRGPLVKQELGLEKTLFEGLLAELM
ncbi:MAG: 2-oxoacid:ferredoxin oxidoreductase subunit beta [Anaerolineales bacterium]|nr:2-oxoacid:ferredoxin oxidoreductase subunit beta [Anaerolineales bacterium]